MASTTRLALALSSLLLACGQKPTPPAPIDPIDHGADDAAGALETKEDSAPPAAMRIPGVAHTANIDRLALAPDGSAAISRDSLGSIRLWPALDGSHEPQIIPARSGNAFALARRGADRFTALVVDGSGGAKIYDLGVDGNGKASAELPPFAAVLGGRVLPGGERVVVLFKDRTIKLLDRQGGELAAFKERRFRPDRIEISADGKVILAHLKQPPVGGSFKAELVRLSIGEAAGTLRISRLGSPRLVESKADLVPASTALSPDGRYFAHAHQHTGGQWQAHVLDLDSDTAVQEVGAKMNNRGLAGVGFVGPRKLLLTPNDGSLGALLDLDDDTTRARPGPPQDFNHQGKAQVIAAGRQIYGYGTWLYVQDAETGKHRFLGYDTAVAQAVAISPSGKNVAWGFNTGPMRVEPIEPTPDNPGVEIVVAESGIGPWKIRFIDDEHVIATDTATNLVLFHWPTRREIARAGVVGAARSVRYDPASGLFAIDRHNNDLRVFEVSPKGIEGPHIVADGTYRFGLLTPKSKSDAVLWTLDSSNKWREYSLAQVRADLSTKALEAMASPLKRGQPVPMAVDRRGRHFGIRSAGSGSEVFVDLGDRLLSKALESADVSAMLVSPDGKRVVLMSTRSGMTFSVRDTATLEEQWTFGTPNVAPEVVWSPDSKMLGIAAQGGAIVLSAEDGSTVRRRCGLRFEAVQAPPMTAFNNLGQRSTCEG